MDGSRLPTEACRQYRSAGLWRLHRFRLSGAGGAVRELEPAPRGNSNCAYVSARRGERASVARHGRQHPGAGRVCRARRAGCQERDPDR